MKFTSIIITHFASNKERSAIFRESIASLIENTKPAYELIVIDNGGSKEDSRFLLDLLEGGKINTYIKNRDNLSFGYARNQGLRLCNGDYICIADNDILYKKGWLKMCIKVLEAYPEKKIYATPVYNVTHWRPRFWVKEVLKVGDDVYRMNSRAGSNCFVMRRKAFEEVGEFLVHRIAGTKFTEEAIEKGYLAAVTPTVMIEDMAFRNGYNFKKAPPLKTTLSNGKEVYFNVDEFRRNNKSVYEFLEQRRFAPQNRIRFERGSN